MFLTVSIEDSRVPLFGSLKYVEKMRELIKKPERVPDFYENNFVVNFEAVGHYGAADEDERIKTKIREVAWLDKMLFSKDLRVNF